MTRIWCSSYINLAISLIIKKISQVLGDSLSLTIFKAKLFSSKRDIQIKGTTNVASVMEKRTITWLRLSL